MDPLFLNISILLLLIVIINYSFKSIASVKISVNLTKYLILIIFRLLGDSPDVTEKRATNNQALVNVSRR